MKRSFAILFIVAAAALAFAAPPKNTPSMIGIHVGPAHPAFVEALYPDIKFLYMPDYQVDVVRDKKNFFEGKAALGAGEGLIADWFAAKTFMAFPRYRGLLFDKNQICVFEGWLGLYAKSATDEKYKMQNASMNISDKKALKVSLDDYVQKAKTAKENPKKDLVKDKDYIGGKIFDIKVVNGAGESVYLPDMVMEAGPTLLFFFTIPADATPAEVSINASMNATSEKAGNAATPGAFLGAMMGGALQSQNTFTAVLDQIELDFFGYLVNKAR